MRWLPVLVALAIALPLPGAARANGRFAAALLATVDPSIDAGVGPSRSPALTTSGSIGMKGRVIAIAVIVVIGLWVFVVRRRRG